MTPLATAGAASLAWLAAAAPLHEHATQTQAPAPAGATTNGGTIRLITQERAFTSSIWYRPR